MSEIWFISDTHFGHTNILQYEADARPFKTIEEMNEVIIDKWNDTVHCNDTIYHLGDFCFGRNNIAIAGRLHGKKRLILGNHDTYASADYLRYFEKLYGVKYLDKFVLSHMPIHHHGLGARWWVNIHGHLHSKKVQKQLPWYQNFVDDENYFNVSCEQNNLTPINFDVIKAHARKVRDE